MNRDQAIRATQTGAVAACFAGILMLGLILAAFNGAFDGALEKWRDAGNFIDVAIIFILAYAVYRKSRVAAILLFAYLVVAKVAMFFETGQLSGIGVTLVFLYFFARAIQGAFTFHRIEKAENPNYKPTPRWICWTGMPILVVIILFLGLGLLTMTGILPSEEVQAGNEISQRHRSQLIESSVIFASDHIEYFYSWGFASILGGGTVLTDDRVILYLPGDEHELEIYELFFNEIASVELIEQGNFFHDSLYRIEGHDPEAWIEISLSVEQDGDAKFIEALRSKLRAPTQNQ